jgi:hypothetical protein
VAERFIELAVTQYYRPLNKTEQQNFYESYKWLIKRWWDLAKLKNQSLAAYMVGDTDWHYEICAELDRLEV